MLLRFIGQSGRLTYRLGRGRVEHDGAWTSRAGLTRFQYVSLGSHVRFNEVVNALANDVGEGLLIEDVDAWRSLPLHRQIANDGAPCLFEIASPPTPPREGSDGSALAIHQDRLEQPWRRGRRRWRLQEFLQPGHLAARWRGLRRQGSGPPQPHAERGGSRSRDELAAATRRRTHARRGHTSGGTVWHGPATRTGRHANRETAPTAARCSPKGSTGAGSSRTATIDTTSGRWAERADSSLRCSGSVLDLEDVTAAKLTSETQAGVISSARCLWMNRIPAARWPSSRSWARCSRSDGSRCSCSCFSGAAHRSPSRSSGR